MPWNSVNSFIFNLIYPSHRELRTSSVTYTAFWIQCHQHSSIDKLVSLFVCEWEIGGVRLNEKWLQMYVVVVVSDSAPECCLHL